MLKKFNTFFVRVGLLLIPVMFIFFPLKIGFYYLGFFFVACAVLLTLEDKLYPEEAKKIEEEKTEEGKEEKGWDMEEEFRRSDDDFWDEYFLLEIYDD